MTRRRPASAPLGPCTDAHAAAITAELVRLCLGGKPDRPELYCPLVDPKPTRRRTRR